jgi:Ca2+-dependent lipid-binding protein
MLRSVRMLIHSQSDPYVRVQVKNETKGRTEVVNNSMSPSYF